jgi:hypothetical protein
MNTSLTRAALVVALAVVASSPMLAQDAAGARQFETGSIYAGPRVWIGNLNGAVAVGGQIEKGFTKPGDYGPGIIAGGLGIDWYTWSYSASVPGIANYGWKYTYIPIQVFSNYHFVIEQNKKIDPYVGLAFVYSIVNASWTGGGTGGSGANASGTTFAGQAGARYFLTDKFALQGQIGFGYGTLGLGATWKF